MAKAEQFNAAGRIWRTLQKALQESEDFYVGRAWGRTLGIGDIGRDQKGLTEVARLLATLSDQIDAAELDIRREGFDEALWADALRSIRDAVSVANLSTKWSGPKSHLTPAAMIALRWCSAVTNGVEEEIDAEAIAELRKSLEVLLDLAQEELPAHAANFVRQQIQVLERAFIEYPIRGRTAFGGAAREVQANADARREDWEPFVDHSVIQDLHEAVLTVAKWGSIWIGLERIDEAGAQIAGFLLSGGL